jgi:hypothetical protein
MNHQSILNLTTPKDDQNIKRRNKYLKEGISIDFTGNSNGHCASMYIPNAPDRFSLNFTILAVTEHLHLVSQFQLPFIGDFSPNPNILPVSSNHA